MRHTCGGPVFGQRIQGCPRCDELAAGAAPRRPVWTTRLGSRARDEAARAERARAHDCQRAQCGSVCVALDW